MQSVDRPVFGVISPEATQPQPPSPNERIDVKAFRKSVLELDPSRKISPRLHVGRQLTLGLPETPPPTLTLIIPVTIFPDNALRQDLPKTTPRKQGEGGLKPKERVDRGAFRRRALAGSKPRLQEPLQE